MAMVMTTNILTPKQSGQGGWAIEMTPQMAHEAGVAEGSVILLHFNAGTLAAEIFPPADEATKRSVQQSIDKFGEAFAEMKRLGD